MKTENEIKDILNWYRSELDGIDRGTIPTQNLLVTRKYYLGAINALNWILGGNNEKNN
jgi:hypothetical protein